MERAMKATRWMVLMAAVLAAACGGDGNGGTGPGNGTPGFTADVTGDVQVSFGGDAAYGLVQDPEAGLAFAVEMSEDDQTGGGVIQLFRVGNGTPQPGTYQLIDAVNDTPEDGDWFAVAYDTDQGQLTAIFVATGGTVKITSVSNGVAKGTFNFPAVGGLFEDPETELTVNVKGRFTAEEMNPGLNLRVPATARSR
jgi:hypothetical protein